MRLYLNKLILWRCDRQKTIPYANLSNTIFIGTYGPSESQIKSACFWDKAIYHINKKTNQKFIKRLKQDKSSDPKEKPCVGWVEATKPNKYEG